MKIIFGLILGLVAVGIFPIDLRMLLTYPGLMFAGMSLVLLVIAYRLIRKKPTATVQSVPAKKSTQSAWWRVSYGFRLSVFLGVIWAVGCFFLEDSYGRNLAIVFWPPIGMVVAYICYRKLVVGESIYEFESFQYPCEKNSIPEGEQDQKGAHDDESTNSISNQTSRERERAMDELISRMK